jgi:hypothetical protein
MFKKLKKDNSMSSIVKDHSTADEDQLYRSALAEFEAKVKARETYLKPEIEKELLVINEKLSQEAKDIKPSVIVHSHGNGFFMSYKNPDDMWENYMTNRILKDVPVKFIESIKISELGEPSTLLLGNERIVNGFHTFPKDVGPRSPSQYKKDKIIYDLGEYKPEYEVKEYKYWHHPAKILITLCSGVFHAVAVNPFAVEIIHDTLCQAWKDPEKFVINTKKPK